VVSDGDVVNPRLDGLISCHGFHFSINMATPVDETFV